MVLIRNLPDHIHYQITMREFFHENLYILILEIVNKEGFFASRAANERSSTFHGYHVYHSNGQPQGLQTYLQFFICSFMRYFVLYLTSYHFFFKSYRERVLH